MAIWPSSARLEAAAVADWAALTRDAPWLETGGIALGEAASEDGRLVVHRLIGPGPKAKRRFRSFEPDTSYTQRELERIWHGSNGRITYLGDWHTHPWGALYPSLTDLGAMQFIATTPSFGTPHPISLITRPAPFSRGDLCASFAIYALVEDATELVALPFEIGTSWLLER